MKLLLIRDYLYENTRVDDDKTHVAHIEDIQKWLWDNFEVRASRKTVINDIRLLREDAGVPVETDRSRNGYVIKDRTFDKQEIRLIIDSVQSAQFIPTSTANALTEKIKSLTDKYTKADLNRKAMVADRVSSMTDSVIKQTDRIYDAISANSTIKFNYFHYNYTQEKYYSKKGAPYEVSPFALYWNNTKLYLFAYLADKKEFRFFRADRMDHISLPTGTPREGGTEFQKLHSRNKDALQGDAVVFDMYQGKEAIVRLQCINKLADVIKDRFASTGMIIPVDDNHFTVSVKVQLSPPFYAWVATFGRQMKIISNKDAVEGMKEFLQKASSMYQENEKV